jgi:hypothetical protein
MKSKVGNTYFLHMYVEIANECLGVIDSIYNTYIFFVKIILNQTRSSQGEITSTQNLDMSYMR